MLCCLIQYSKGIRTTCVTARNGSANGRVLAFDIVHAVEFSRNGRTRSHLTVFLRATSLTYHNHTPQHTNTQTEAQTPTHQRTQKWIYPPTQPPDPQDPNDYGVRDFVPLEAGKHCGFFRTCGVTRDDNTRQNTGPSNTPHIPGVSHQQHHRNTHETQGERPWNSANRDPRRSGVNGGDPAVSEQTSCQRLSDYL